ncbi:MAG: MerR family transcriptional regulator [Acidimicrobiales bacterium]
MAERAHLSIGEVLSLLREEFSDVTISKIRFLESQGLVDPERTPSGYRKFYEHDVERLRWILRQQKENFLPLKVIRGRLSEAGDGDGEDDADGDGGLAAAEVTTAATLTYLTGAGEDSRRAGMPLTPPAAAVPTPLSRLPGPTLMATPAPGEPSRGDPSRGEPTKAAMGVPEADPPDEPETFTAKELAVAAGAAPELVKELEEHGLIEARASVGGSAYFDRDDLAVVRAAAGFAKHGVEARHLRTWRNGASREADLFGQVVLPLLKQRNPAARQQALDLLDELSELGGQLRVVLLREALRDLR